MGRPCLCLPQGEHSHSLYEALPHYGLETTDPQDHAWELLISVSSFKNEKGERKRENEPQHWKRSMRDPYNIRLAPT